MMLANIPERLVMMVIQILSMTLDSNCACEGSPAGSGSTETFSSQTDNSAISSKDWVNVAVKGQRTWVC